MSETVNDTGEELIPEKLAEFVRSYLVAALWSSNDDKDDPLDDNYTVDDLDQQLQEKLGDTCLAFLSKAKEFIDLVLDHGYSYEQAGHDFWLSHNGHGAGFTDRGIGEVGERLETLAKEHSAYLLYVDDGKIYSE